jgi:hypothetical protein
MPATVLDGGGIQEGLTFTESAAMIASNLEQG